MEKSERAHYYQHISKALLFVFPLFYADYSCAYYICSLLLSCRLTMEEETYLHTNIFTIENFVILLKEKSMYCLQLEI